MKMVYSYMYANRNETVGNLWIGTAGAIASDLTMTKGQVYKALGMLIETGAMEKIRNGGNGMGSAYKLIKAPSKDDLERLLEQQKGVFGDIVTPSKYERTMDSVNKLNTRINTLAARLGEVELWIEEHSND